MPYIRAVGIVIHQSRLLLIHREQDGRSYFVFPGGHKETNETIEQAVAREVLEETSIVVSIGALLYHHTYDDGSERYYFQCMYLDGEPQLGGPEKGRLTENNHYQPEWIPLESLPQTLVYPLEIRDWILEDVKNNFQNTPRHQSVIFANLRQTPDS